MVGDERGLSLMSFLRFRISEYSAYIDLAIVFHLIIGILYKPCNPFYFYIVYVFKCKQINICSTFSYIGNIFYEYI